MRVSASAAGPASCIQILDEPGKAEEMELMR